MQQSLNDILILYVITTIAIWGYIDTQYKGTILIDAFFAIAISFYFSYLGHFPPPVAQSIIYILYSLNILALSVGRRDMFQRMYYQQFITILSISVYSVVLYILLISSNINRQKIQCLSRLVSAVPENTFTVIWGDALPYEWQYVFSDNEVFKKRNFLIEAWLQRTPLNEDKHKHFKIKDLYIDLVKKKNIYVAAYNFMQPLLKTYIKEHYGIDTKFEIIKDFHECHQPAQLVKISEVNR